MVFLDCNTGFTGQKLLHEAFFLFLQGCEFLVEEGDFFIAGGEDFGDAALFLHTWQWDLQRQKVLWV